ncbi:MAG TPA: hypothetical protein VHM27_07455, partial [Rhizomicrobium sp.]|nr:hypothetical protein [Rhizomicrobium sp.]
MSSPHPSLKPFFKSATGPSSLSDLYSVTGFHCANLSADWLNWVMVLAAFLRHVRNIRTAYGIARARALFDNDYQKEL